MEAWAIVTLVLGASVISSLLTFFITKMQVSHSDKRFEKELERTRETDSRQRRREVRGEPLVKLRSELALLAAKSNKLVTTASMLHTNIFSGASDEQIKGWLDTVSKDWNNYVDSGVFEQILFTVDDQEIAEKVEEIRLEYRRLYIVNLNWKSFPEKLPETLTLPKELRNRVREVQSLINKRLEEL